MLTEEDLNSCAATIEDQISRIGDDVIEIEEWDYEEDNQTYPAIAIVAEEQSYNCIYQVMGSTRYEPFVIKYTFDLTTAIAQSIQESPNEEQFDQDIETDSPRELAIGVIERINENDLDRLTYQLHDKISNPKVISSVHEDNERRLKGFSVNRHIFPQGPNYNLSDFYDAMTAVTSTGEIGSRYLENSFAIRIPEDSEKEYDISFGLDEVFS